MCNITGVGERLHKVLGKTGSELWFPWFSTFSQLFFIRSFLQVTRTCIKFRTSSNFGQIGPLTMELAALGHLKKNSHRFIMGKCCLHASLFIDQIIIKVAGNQDRHKSSDEFDFGPDQTSHFRVTCP